MKRLLQLAVLLIATVAAAQHVGIGIPITRPKSVAGGSGVPSSSLLQGLTSFWPLSESGGARTDFVGGFNLTDNNTVGFQNAGPNAVVASYVAASQESTTALITSGTGDLTLAGWVYYDGTFTSFEGFARFSTQDAYSVASTVLGVYGNNPNTITFETATTTGSLSQAIRTGADAFVPGWNFVVAIRDASVATSRVGFSINGAAINFQTAAATGVDQSASRLAIGRIGTAANHYSDTRQGLWGYWQRQLTNADVTSLYNKGRGKLYADLSLTEKTDLVSYWNLNEVSGNRADSHGANTLTDNNTVGSFNNAPTWPTGLPTIAASFINTNSESLSRADFLDTSADYTMMAWMRRNGGGGTYSGFMAQANAFIAGYALNGGSGGNHLIYDSVGFIETLPNLSIADNTWALTIVWLSTTDGKIYFQVDNGTVAERVYTPPPVNNTNTFEMGHSGIGHYWNGQISTAAVWSRVLTPAERACLWNSGAGSVYPYTGLCE